MTYRIRLTDRAQADLNGIINREIQDQIMSRINRLAQHPESGKVLRGILKGYRSVRAARNRYRIIYRVQDEEILVVIVMIGLRKGSDFGDVYKSFERFIKKEQ